ncbi:hypothetical protein G7Y89_g10835 [Cudoniella acicularis]|uniref:Uncharacterized protein n=1 Tax=Cudoniella acicularis TaxID=354080 RepID=A0A8H4RBZ5_9HELO|nr:hypothetical protein G7Y89_g10835 [Cudoniella acicularis]
MFVPQFQEHANASIARNIIKTSPSAVLNSRSHLTKSASLRTAKKPSKLQELSKRISSLGLFHPLSTADNHRASEEVGQRVSGEYSQSQRPQTEGGYVVQSPSKGVFDGQDEDTGDKWTLKEYKFPQPPRGGPLPLRRRNSEGEPRRTLHPRPGSVPASSHLAAATQDSPLTWANSRSFGAPHWPSVDLSEHAARFRNLDHAYTVDKYGLRDWKEIPRINRPNNAEFVTIGNEKLEYRRTEIYGSNVWRIGPINLDENAKCLQNGAENYGTIQEPQSQEGAKVHGSNHLKPATQLASDVFSSNSFPTSTVKGKNKMPIQEELQKEPAVDHAYKELTSGTRLWKWMPHINLEETYGPYMNGNEKLEYVGTGKTGRNYWRIIGKVEPFGDTGSSHLRPVERSESRITPVLFDDSLFTHFTPDISKIFKSPLDPCRNGAETSEPVQESNSYNEATDQTQAYVLLDLDTQIKQCSAQQMTLRDMRNRFSRGEMTPADVQRKLSNPIDDRVKRQIGRATVRIQRQVDVHLKDAAEKIEIHQGEVRRLDRIVAEMKGTIASLQGKLQESEEKQKATLTMLEHARIEESNAKSKVWEHEALISELKKIPNVGPRIDWYQKMVQRSLPSFNRSTGEKVNSKSDSMNEEVDRHGRMEDAFPKHWVLQDAMSKRGDSSY